MKNLKILAHIRDTEIVDIREYGFPDVLDYEGDGAVVISWWVMDFKNKKIWRYIYSFSTYCIIISMMKVKLLEGLLFQSCTTSIIILSY